MSSTNQPSSNPCQSSSSSSTDESSKTKPAADAPCFKHQPSPAAKQPLAVQRPPALPILSHAVSVASTDTPLEGLPSNVSSDCANRKLPIGRPPRRRRTVEAVVPASSPRIQISSHRRCASTISSLPGRRSRAHAFNFAHTLRRATFRREINSVKSLIAVWPDDAATPEQVIILDTDEDGFNLVQTAVAVRAPTILQELLGALPTDHLRTAAVHSFGSSPNKYSPLHLASLKNDAQSAALLLDHGADPNAKSKSDATALHVAIGTGHLQIVRLLLDNGANPNAVTQLGNLPLLSAVHKRSPELVKLLLDAGADPRARNKEGCCAHVLAEDMCASELVEMMDKLVR